MNTRFNNHREDRPHKLYKQAKSGVLFGICSGISDYFGLSVMGVRALFVLGSFFSPLFFLAYILMIFLLESRPEELYVSHEELRFRRSAHFAPRDLFSSVKHQFRKTEDRVRRMENYVTSSEFELQQKYRDLSGKGT